MSQTISRDEVERYVAAVDTLLESMSKDHLTSARIDFQKVHWAFKTRLERTEEMDEQYRHEVQQGALFQELRRACQALLNRMSTVLGQGQSTVSDAEAEQLARSVQGVLEAACAIEEFQAEDDAGEAQMTT